MKYLRLALFGAALAAPAMAQPVQFSAILNSEMGYVTNPFLVSGLTEGSISSSASIQPRLFYATARSTTTLSGRYSRETYLHDFGYTDSGSINVLRTDQLSQYLSSSLTANYSTTNSAAIDDPTQIIEDPATFGRRTKTLSGSYQLQWQASARDQLSYGAQATHQSFGSGADQGVGIASSYSQYAVNAGYNRVVDARTSVGAQVSLSDVRSQIYPDSRVIQPAFTAKRQISAIWTIDGHIGVSLQHVLGPVASSTTSLGLGVNLCAAYPHTHLCLRLSHDAQPSGYGPLRTASSIGGELSHEFDEHSRVTLNAQYLKDSADGVAEDIPGVNPLLNNTKAILASVDYDRDVTQRISVGFGGRYKQRELESAGTGRSYAATVHVRAKLGRQ